MSLALLKTVPMDSNSTLSDPDAVWLSWRMTMVTCLLLGANSASVIIHLWEDGKAILKRAWLADMLSFPCARLLGVAFLIVSLVILESPESAHIDCDFSTRMAVSTSFLSHASHHLFLTLHLISHIKTRWYLAVPSLAFACAILALSTLIAKQSKSGTRYPVAGCVLIIDMSTLPGPALLFPFAALSLLHQCSMSALITFSKLEELRNSKTSSATRLIMSAFYIHNSIDMEVCSRILRSAGDSARSERRRSSFGTLKFATDQETEKEEQRRMLSSSSRITRSKSNRDRHYNDLLSKSVDGILASNQSQEDRAMQQWKRTTDTGLTDALATLFHQSTSPSKPDHTISSTALHAAGPLIWAWDTAMPYHQNSEPNASRPLLNKNLQTATMPHAPPSTDSGRNQWSSSPSHIPIDRARLKRPPSTLKVPGWTPVREAPSIISSDSLLSFQRRRSSIIRYYQEGEYDDKQLTASDDSSNPSSGQRTTLAWI